VFTIVIDGEGDQSTDPDDISEKMIGSEAVQELYSRAIENLEEYSGKNKDREEDVHRVMRALDIMDEIVSWGTALELPILEEDEKLEVKLVPMHDEDDK
jgi:hypothetical protein